jgi:predicted signal transduction protein with EAL and GGDEF domain
VDSASETAIGARRFRLAQLRKAAADTRWLLIGNLVVVAVAVAWTTCRATGLWAPKPLVWVLVPLGMGLTAVASYAASRTSGAQPATRRFWRQLSVAIFLIGIGATMITGATLRRPVLGAVNAPPAAMAIIAVAMLLVLWALLRLPMGTRTRGDWLRLTLDGATVTLAAALALWHLALRPQLDSDRDIGTFVGLLLMSVIALVALVAVMKVMLIGGGAVHPTALRLLALTALVGGLNSVTAPLLAEPRWLGLQPLATTIDAALACWAAHAQFRSTNTPAPRRRKRGARPYSVLPYVGVAATDLLLILAVARGDEGIGVVAAGAVAVTAVVVLRQLVAFRDNADLLSSVQDQQQRLEHQASHDALTGLPNRFRFAEQITAALADGHPGTTVLLIDLDDFKTINDTLGHTIGDEVIVAVADRLRTAVDGDELVLRPEGIGRQEQPDGIGREEQLVARLGGDEFAVLLRGVPGDAVDDVASRLLGLLTRPVATSAHQLLVDASAGVAQAMPGDDVHALLRNAEIAMYSAKEQSNSSFVRFSPDLAARVRAHAELGAQLRDAIGTDQLYLVYQPIVRLDDGAIVGTEALIRWNHPLRGHISPAEFIPTAEHTGLIVPIGRWVLGEACRQAAQWQAHFGDAAPYSMNVNVSGWQLRDPNFLEDVRAGLARTGLPAKHLVIEVTETAVLEGAQITATLEALRDMDIRLALDDFGTAASSLGLLLTCPVTTLKLDRTFVEGITTVERQRAVATAVLHIAEALNLHTVAEGIEHPDQAHLLRELGYREAQGYLFAKPLTVAQVEQRLTANWAGRGHEPSSEPASSAPPVPAALS